MPQNPLSKEQIRAELAQHEQNQALYARLIEKRKEHLDYAKGIVKRMRSHNQAPFFFYHEVEFGLQRETIDSAIPFGTPLEEAVRRANAEWNRLPASQKNITFNEIKKNLKPVQESLERMKLMQKESQNRAAMLKAELESRRLIPRIKSTIRESLGRIRRR